MSPATDNSFDRRWDRDRFVLWGTCIHCRRRLLLADDGSPISQAHARAHLC